MLRQLATSYSYNFNYSSSSTFHLSGMEIGAFILIGLILYAIAATGLWKVFIKAGREGWPAIIPIYNTWVLFEIAGKPGWWALIGLVGVIPLLGIFAGIAFLVFYIITMLELAKRFNKSTVFAVFGLIIFSVVGFLILGFGKDKYRTSVSPKDSDEPEPPKSQITN